MICIENRTIDEITIGDSACLTRTLSRRDIQLFAAMSGDVNPTHMDEAFASSSIFHKLIAHGMWGGALISALLGTELPGPGTVYLGQTLRFRRPIGLGDTVTVRVTATGKDRARRRVTFACEVVKQDGEIAIEGTAEVLAPARKICIERPPLPEVEIHAPDERPLAGGRCPGPEAQDSGSLASRDDESCRCHQRARRSTPRPRRAASPSA